MSNLQRLETLHPDVISDFLETGKSSAMPVELQRFILQLQWVVEIRENGHERNINRAAAKLRNRILVEQKIKLSIPACKVRISQALTYFHVDLNVPQKVWDLDTANKLEDLAKLAIKDNDWRTARQLYLDSNEYKRRASQTLSDEDFEPHVFLMDPKITGEDLGFEEGNLKEIATKCNDGFYVKLITQLPTDKENKKQLANDAEVDITDAEWEEVKDAK